MSGNPKEAAGKPTEPVVTFTYAYNRNDSPTASKAAVESRQTPTTPDGAVDELFTSNGLYAQFIAECKRPASEPGSYTPVCIRLTPREVGADSQPFPEFPLQKPFAAF